MGFGDGDVLEQDLGNVDVGEDGGCTGLASVLSLQGVYRWRKGQRARDALLSFSSSGSDDVKLSICCWKLCTTDMSGSGDGSGCDGSNVTAMVILWAMSWMRMRLSRSTSDGNSLLASMALQHFSSCFVFINISVFLFVVKTLHSSLLASITFTCLFQAQLLTVC